MNAAFSRVLASARADFNRRFVEARHRYPELTPERFAAVLQGPGDAIVAAAEQAAPGSAGAVAQGVYDAALLLVGQRRRLLKYLTKTDINRYRSIIERLGIRR